MLQIFTKGADKMAKTKRTVKKTSNKKSLIASEKKLLQAIKEGELKKVPISKIKQLPENPNDDFSQIDCLQKILKANGQITPVVVWKKNNTIYKGNHTHEAMRLNGSKEILALYVDFPSSAAAMAYAIADNESSAWTEMNHDVLAAIMQSDEMQSLDEDEIKMLTGIKDKDYKSLMLSGSMPDALPDVDISGEVSGKSKFLTITFDDDVQIEKFKKRMGKDNIFHNQVIEYKNLLKKMTWRKSK
jgi:hypothetical protein